MTCIAEAPDRLRVHWVIAEGYYLYRDKLSIALADGTGVTLGGIDIPPGETKHDEFFGDVQVFHDEIVAGVTLARSTRDASDITLVVGYQGCAEAGICYPPIKKQLPVTLAALDATTPLAAAAPTATPTNPTDALEAPSQDRYAKVLSESGLAGSSCFSSAPACCWRSPPACTR